MLRLLGREVRIRARAESAVIRRVYLVRRPAASTVGALAHKTTVLSGLVLSGLCRGICCSAFGGIFDFEGGKVMGGVFAIC